MSLIKEYRPEFTLVAEGEDITQKLQQGLIELRLTDNGGSTAKADELQITLIGKTMQLSAKGARPNLGLGLNGHIQDKGWFIVADKGKIGGLL